MTIFLVDDERVILYTLAIILRQAGYTVEAYLDGESALHAATLHPPQMLITDVRMTPMDGLELASRITSMFQACKVLFITAELTLELRSHQSESWSYLQKPVHPRRLLEAVGSLTKPVSSSAALYDNDLHLLPPLQEATPLARIVD